jgi:hypothetical protein
MPSDAATAITYTGAFVGLVGGGVALFNSWKAVCWKRAELANSYLRDFDSNPELVFAGLCLDWQGGKLALPTISALICRTMLQSFSTTAKCSRADATLRRS